MKLTLVVHDLANNALGRAYCWWLLAEEVGWPLEVVGPSSTGELWQPLAGSPFDEVCSPVDRDALPGVLETAVRTSDLMVAIKAFPGSFGVVRQVHRRTDAPFLVDIDDADLDAWLDALPLHAKLGLVRPSRWSRGEHTFQLRALRRHARSAPATVSNPELQRMYGGAIVPHVRRPRPEGGPHTRDRPVVAFVGTPRSHKGLEVLRGAVAAVAAEGFELLVTAPEPRASHPWESWVGATAFERGWDIVDGADIVVVPSMGSRYAEAQFPVKTVDAMLSARAIVASDLPVLRWVLGDHARFVAPGSVPALTDALRGLREPGARTAIGRAARGRALSRFTPDAAASDWTSVLQRIVAAG